MSEIPTITGTVVSGAGRGRQLGYPTANLALPVSSTIADGVFVARVMIAGQALPSRGAAFVGTPAMFGDSERRLEVHLLEFTGSLVGQELTVQLLEKIRAVLHFDSSDALVAAIAEDVRATERYFEQHSL